VAKADSNPGGRPEEYTPDIGDLICAQLAQGMSLRTVCKDEALPCCATVFNWLRKHPEFLEHYEKAKEESADALAEEIIDIADNATNDWMEREGYDEGSGYGLNGEHIQRSRLRVDARKWIASKLKPKKYGDKTTTAITDPDGNALVVQVVKFSDNPPSSQ
jgi:hypothetical protein